MAKLETKYSMDIQWEIMIYEIMSELRLQQGLKDAALTEHHWQSSYNVTSKLVVGDDSLLSMSAQGSWDLIVSVPPSITAKPYAMCVQSVQSMSSGMYLPILGLQEEGEFRNWRTLKNIKGYEADQDGS